jgi:hypothetical protein
LRSPAPLEPFAYVSRPGIGAWPGKTSALELSITTQTPTDIPVQ